MVVRIFLFSVVAAVAPAFSGTTAAQSLYDQKLERLILDRVAGRIGDIRPGFAPGQTPVIILPLEDRPEDTVTRGSLHWPEQVQGADPVSPSEAALLRPFYRQQSPSQEEMSRTASRVVYF